MQETISQIEKKSISYDIKLNEKTEAMNEQTMRKSNIANFIRRGKGMCFNYALKNQDIWNIEDSFNILETRYKQINLQEAKRGDIITIHDIDNSIPEFPRYTCQHFVIIKKMSVNIGDITIRSKWGGWAIYENKLKDLPTQYGNTIVIWRKISKYDRLTLENVKRYK